MKSRYVSFFIEPEQTAAVKKSVDEILLPSLSGLPGFLGLVVVQMAQGRRMEVVAISMWDDRLPDSEPTSRELIDRLRVAGFRPVVHDVDAIRVLVRDMDGGRCLDWASPRAMEGTDLRPWGLPHLPVTPAGAARLQVLLPSPGAIPTAGR
jgi:hypothetical protein